ncbi:MAG: AGE family epimerase/isomerase [Alphaproteobacteria bacterium]
MAVPDPVAVLRRRLFDDTLPIWRDRGVDPGRGFHERLDLSLQPVTALGKRALVQARQIYVFSHMALLGLVDGAEAAATAGLDFLLAHYRHPEGGWRHRVAADGAPMDDARNLYDQAFAIFAMAWHHRAFRDPRALPAAEETLAFLDATLVHPAGGYREGLDADGAFQSGPRRQNPHMHLLEATLALYETTGDARYRERAAALVDLFRRRFLVEGSLREYLTDDLVPAAGEAGRQVEPGHHFEWVWLLHEHARLTGDATVRHEADILYRFALAHGLDAASGEAIDMVDAGGRPLKRRRRIWPQTEAIKAHAAQALAGDDAAPARLQAQCAALLRDHFATPPGTWHEHLDEAGTPFLDHLPATSLYHLGLAAVEAGRAAAARG